MTFEIVVRDQQDDPRLDDVRAILQEHNQELNPAFFRDLETSSAARLNVVALTNDGDVAGGLIAETRGRWLKIHILSVQKARRRRGLGSQILRAAESEARARHCDRAFLETLDYQGPEFYESCGYQRRCELEDWDSHGHAKFVYVKELSG